MKTSFVNILFIVFVCSFISCGTNQDFQSHFPQEIKKTFVQKNTFFIAFDQPLSANLQLISVHYNKQHAALQSASQLSFTGILKATAAPTDLILDADPAKEYGNKAPAIHQPQFKLEPNQAVLEYKLNHKTYFYKIQNVVIKQ
ncbi:MAG: hypothetical protein ACK4M4_00525 [Flavobacterium sp.]